MSVKSDRWIKRMAKEHGMIEPFVEGQVNRGVISYGVSSYGYDIRVGREFKIFTNMYGAIVDPKAFDPKSFVDIVTDDYCTIPPNSFALARTIEYFRIPRSVITICLGKSTYARCFRGDTRVSLVDGTTPTLEEMAVRSQKGEMFWGYSISSTGRIIVTLLEAPRYIGRDSLIEIVLDNGQPIHCTPDHEFIMRDGQMMQAHELRAGDSLMPLYRQLVRGYEAVYQPLNGHIYPTHRLADEWNLAQEIYEDKKGTHRHHMDGNRLNNNPWNITRMQASEHIRYHNKINYGEDFDPEEHGASIRSAYERYREDSEWVERLSAAQRKRAIDFWKNDKYSSAREKLLEQLRNPSVATREAHRQVMINRYKNPKERERVAEWSRAAWAKASLERKQKQSEIARSIRIREEITKETVSSALHQTGSIRGAARLLECDRTVFRRFPDVVDNFRGLVRKKNHRIVAVRELAGTHDVYCLTVPEAGNFALEAGVFVSNCGLIVNVTPFEPEWEGNVTLEISNTTPLPAKVYANEGIAQVIFLESDEVCEVSYADKKGKYQKQQEITLPKMVK